MVSLLAAGCHALGYYGRSLWGGGRILAKRRPIAAVLADRETAPGLARQLELALAIRRFSIGELGLPDNGSYRSYVDLGRSYAAWNVVAAPEFSVEPLTWCFAFAGCVTYRGYFSPERARRFAARLRRDGYDVQVTPVVAFSTLGWFQDPVLNTFVDRPEGELAGLIVHELAHQVVYLKDDTTFNESFATVVEVEGVGRWLTSRGRPGALAQYREQQRRERAVVELLLAYRERLAAIYELDRPDDGRRRSKAREIASLRADYESLKQGWGGDPRFDAWFGSEVNNATLAAVAAYHDLVPAFEALLATSGGELSVFFAEVRRLASLAPGERKAELQRLQDLFDSC